jgi:hypothetical protein
LARRARRWCTRDHWRLGRSWHASLGWFIGALAFIVPFALGGLGGGDVKLLAAIGAWLGPAGAFWVALYAGVAGGVMALGVALATVICGARSRTCRCWLMHWKGLGFAAPLRGFTRRQRRAATGICAADFCWFGDTLWLR